MGNARNFDNYVGRLQEAGVRVSVILSDLHTYDNVLDYNIPVIISAILTFAGWSVFHYLAYPKLETDRRSISGGYFFALTVFLIFLSSFILLRTTLYFDFRYDGDHNPVGFKIMSDYRLLSVATAALSTLTLFFLYEVLSQLYYNFCNQQRWEANAKYSNYVIIACVLALDLFIIFSGVVSAIFDFGFRQMLSLFLGAIMIYELRNFFSKAVIIQMHSSPAFSGYLKNMAVYIVLCLGCSVIAWGLFSNFGQSVKPGVFYAFAFIVLTLAPILLSYISQKEKITLQTSISNKSAELSGLRSQINPHFLFNALNSLYATALKENSEKTADGIQKLGDMMRFMLHENNHDRIPLSSEITYLHNYIEIQRMRLDESQNIEIRINIQEPGPEISIAPMLLNPFIENAFKHGISLRNPSWIYITLTFDENRIYFKVHNSVHVMSGGDPEEKNSGIGLENVEKRLKLIYPARHELYIQKSAQDFFASLTLDY
ncbi:sensor protein lytS [Dyadobacter psychrotolerans]|uniref:Sensor protein lytS n=2 Tax=Dyadobacter psychrotolerans TaxID=2541721 RepID=A0A4R5DEB6_9BACT|nr:sensor protein lytS [Dyadobacter psychrotolerans]